MRNNLYILRLTHLMFRERLKMGHPNYVSNLVNAE